MKFGAPGVADSTQLRFPFTKDTIYNRRRKDIELILVLAAEVQPTDSVTLTWEHSEYRWATATECQELLGFRGLLDGLEWTRRYVTEPAKSYPELKLA